MPLSAIIMMIMSLLVLWGGLAVAIVLLVKAKPATPQTTNDTSLVESASHNEMG